MHYPTYRYPLTLKEVDEGGDDAAGKGVKDPDEDADHDNADDHDHRVVYGLLGSGPHDLLELALHLAEPTGDTLEKAGLFVLLGLLVRLRGLGSGLGVSAGLFDLLVVRHSVSPFFLVTLPQASSLGLGVERVLSAEGAVLVSLQTVGSVLLVLVGDVVALFALGASQGDLHPRTGFCHVSAPPSMVRAQQKMPGPAIPNPSTFEKGTGKARLQSKHGRFGMICLPMSSRGGKGFVPITP